MFNMMNIGSGRFDPSIILLFLLSLIYGPIGIAGMATGEFIIDIIFFNPVFHNSVFYNSVFHNSVSHSPVLLSLVYVLLVSFLGYFNYKLFYAFNFKNKQPLLRLRDVKNLIKFIVISIIVFAFNSYLMTFVNYELFHPNYEGINVLRYFHSNFIFLITLNLVFNLLILSTHSLFNLKVYKPKKSKLFLNHPKTFNILICISSIALIIQMVYIILSENMGFIITKDHIIALVFNIILIMLLVVFKPITKDVVAKKVNNSFNEFIVFIFMLIYSLSWFSNILLDLYDNNFFKIESFVGVGDLTQLFISFIFLIIILYYMQNNFSKHLRFLYKITRDYDLIKISNNVDNENDDSKNIEDILHNLKNLSNSKYELGQLADSLKDMIEDIELYITNLKKVTTEKEKIIVELDMAYKIQSSVIPNIFPPFPDRLNDFDIYASFNPARNVGGDFYDYFLIDDDHLVLVIGDVSGKGVPAALFMMIVKSLINYLINSGLSPSEAFYQLNNQLLENNNEEMFVTVWLGILEISSGKLTYVNAGHNLPYLFNKSTNQYDVLAAKPNFILGGMDNIKYTQHEIKIKEGDRLYLFTDGITETINQNEEEFSNDRLLNLLNNKSNYSIKDLILEISNEIHNFSENMEQFDDETMLLLEYMRGNI
jgi:sigma-B regulation protein RsbU (phosphoserine phosphatase)